MNNAIVRKVTIGTSYAPLTASQLVGSATISAPLTNTDAVYLRSDDDTEDIPWQPGDSFTFVGIDFSTLLVKGTVGDILTINGGTW